MNDNSTASTSTRQNEPTSGVFYTLSQARLDQFKFIEKMVRGADEFLVLCAFGSVEVVRALLKEDKTRSAITNDINMNAAHFACYGGNEDVAKLLYNFNPDLFDAKTETGLSCAKLAEQSPYDTTAIKEWLASLVEKDAKTSEQPNAKKRRTKESGIATEKQMTEEHNRAAYYIECFEEVKHMTLMTAAFFRDDEVSLLAHFRALVKSLRVQESENLNKLGMNVFHFACYGGNWRAIEFILAEQPQLLTSLTAEGLSGVDVLNMGFGDNTAVKEWLVAKDPKFFKRNAELVRAAAADTAPEDQKSVYDTLIKKMIGSAQHLDLKSHQCYTNLCTALHSVDMKDKYCAVCGFLATACEIQNVEGVVLNTTLVGFEKVYSKLVTKISTGVGRS